MSGALLEAKGVRCELGGVEVLRGVDLVAREGEKIGIVGPNGAGKTTLLRVLAGVLEADDGVVRAHGDASPDAVRRAVGLASDVPALHGDAPLASSLAFAARLRGVPERAIEGRVRDVLARVGLTAHASARADQLSWGERRRAGLAQAIVHDPAVLLLDEPSAGLDPVQRAELAAWIEALPADRALVASSHDLDELSQSCDRVVLLDRGSVLADGTIDALIEQLVDDLELDLEISGDPDVALAMLPDASLVRRSERSLHLRVRARAADRADIVRRLVLAGIEVRGLAPRRPWLAAALASARVRERPE